MTSLERETRIQHTGALMLAAYARYEASGCFADRGAADGLRLAMQADISARAPAQVALLESERGIT